ncbi:GGDEF domain-containing response regulator [cyanobacterium TDX16]|nr:GGDEF domain-containing response regulator [cyanobacterium TDX16]
MVDINQRSSILIIDDSPINVKGLFKILQHSGFIVSVANSGEKALLKIKYTLPDLILLDVVMVGMNGFETCRHLKANPATQDIPVIFISALDEATNKAECFAVGGVDYITKPFTAEEVLARVRHQLALRAAKIEIERLNQELEARVRQRTLQLEAVNRQLQQEISDRHQVQEQLIYSALHDALTHLPNRTLLMERLEMALQRVKRYPDHLFAVLFIDLDRFKTINDSLGHQVGDRLLLAIAHQLQQLVRSTDTVARLGGDEFIILLDPIQDINDAIRVAERIHTQLRSPLQLASREVFISASIGIAASATHYQQGSELLRDADIAMYRAKEQGKARYEIFDRAMYAEAIHKLQIENDLRQAAVGQEFHLNYQPIVSLDTGRIIGFEALLRWLHPERGLISPSQFIPIAEETGLVVPIGEWVLFTACSQMKQWQTKFSHPPAKISVNLSLKQLREPDFLEKIDRILTETEIAAESLNLELTESMLMDNVEELIFVLGQLRARNIRLSIDDFGTGYSSLSYLHRFPIDYLKVDRAFISGIGAGGKSRQIAATIISLAHQLGIKAIAEGVETPTHLQHLHALDCEEAQGYLFSKPLDLAAAESLMLTNPQW